MGSIHVDAVVVMVNVYHALRCIYMHEYSLVSLVHIWLLMLLL